LTDSLRRKFTGNHPSRRERNLSNGARNPPENQTFNNELPSSALRCCCGNERDFAVGGAAKLWLYLRKERKRPSNQRLNRGFGPAWQITNQNTPGQRICHGFFDLWLASEDQYKSGCECLISF
jgi:hypothetical protein